MRTAAGATMAAVPSTIDAPAGAAAVSEPDKPAVAKPVVEISPERGA